MYPSPKKKETPEKTYSLIPSRLTRISKTRLQTSFIPPYLLITKFPHHLAYPGMAPARFRNRDNRTDDYYPRNDRLYLSKQIFLSVAILAQC